MRFEKLQLIGLFVLNFPDKRNLKNLDLIQVNSFLQICHPGRAICYVLVALSLVSNLKSCTHNIKDLHE